MVSWTLLLSWTEQFYSRELKKLSRTEEFTLLNWKHLLSWTKDFYTREVKAFTLLKLRHILSRTEGMYCLELKACTIVNWRPLHSWPEDNVVNWRRSNELKTFTLVYWSHLLPWTSQWTFGFHKFEILPDLLNDVWLIKNNSCDVTVLWILYLAYPGFKTRLRDRHYLIFSWIFSAPTRTLG
jgi:hypothetical protein